MPRLLLDLSAWARSSHPSALERWAQLVETDRLLCHPVFAIELLHNAFSPQRYAEMSGELAAAFDWVHPDRETAEIAQRLQGRMATQVASGQRVKTADLLIAALAVQHGLGVLHYDADYDQIRDRGGEPFDSEWLAPRGSLDAAEGSATRSRKAYRKAFGERMVLFQGDADLELWPALITWLEGELAEQGLPIPPPPDIG